MYEKVCESDSGLILVTALFIAAFIVMTFAWLEQRRRYERMREIVQIARREAKDRRDAI